MFFAALATDYDGTVATDGLTPENVLDSLRRFKETGRRLILVTGRELPDLISVFPGHQIFDRIVAENGAVLYEPGPQRTRALGPPPSADFVRALQEQQITPLSVGEVIVATWEPNQAIVLETIKRLGLELQIIFNKGAVMVLPPNINKASGLMCALEELGLSPVNVVGIGDAENDHAFLNYCGCSAAVANALPKIKEHVDLVLGKPRGAGVQELMEMVANKDSNLLPAARHGISLGQSSDGQEVVLPSLAGNVLLAGHSAVGKSTIATALTERMAERGLQFVVIDPEGDFEQLEKSTQLGDGRLAPSLDQAADLLKRIDNNLVINALAVPLDDRPQFFSDILSMVIKMRGELGRPHWLIVDEAHHVLPSTRDTVPETLPHELTGTILITVHSDSVAHSALDKIRFVIAAGSGASQELQSFCTSLKCQTPRSTPPCGEREVLLWDRQIESSPICVTPTVPAQIHRRHTRKYAEGELGPDKSFYFRGPDQRLNLRAQNLITFLAIGDGVDDETWEFHRQQHDYSTWFRQSIKDEQMAHIAQQIEDGETDGKTARERLREEIEQRYTAPAKLSS